MHSGCYWSSLGSCGRVIIIKLALILLILQIHWGDSSSPWSPNSNAPTFEMPYTSVHYTLLLNMCQEKVRSRNNLCLSQTFSTIISLPYHSFTCPLVMNTPSEGHRLGRPNEKAPEYKTGAMIWKPFPSLNCRMNRIYWFAHLSSCVSL